MEEHTDSFRYRGEIEFFLEEVSPEHVTSRMPVTAGIRNPFGTVHAGALLWLADVTATILALGRAEIAESEKGFPLAVSLHTSFLGNQRDGEIRAEARFVRRGKRVTAVRTRLMGQGDRLLAEVTTTHVPAV